VRFFTKNKSDSDEELVKKCCQGHALAQRSLYERFAPKMMGVCRRYVGQNQDAEEVLSQGFIKVFSRIQDFKGHGSLEGWIRTIMVRESLMYLRANKHRWQETEMLDNWTDNWEVSAPAAFEADYLLQMIDSLPSGYRKVFNLYAIDGYKHHEIAEMLGISENTSKTQLMRARAQLKEQLEEIKKKETLSLKMEMI
jgi:RNA polymerase sigma factor (sigma-70 family)